MVARRNKSNGKANGRSGSVASRQSPPHQAIGWESYQGWISRLGNTRRRRQAKDALYTWRGYRDWAAKVRANWDRDEK